jgi:hypothetical protein
MDDWTEQSEAAFAAYVEDLVSVIGHAGAWEKMREDVIPTYKN